MISSLTSAQVLLACSLVFAMGIAIQHGGTCMVAAVDEWLKEGRTSRFRGLVEAAVWVFAGLLLFSASWEVVPVLAYKTTQWTWVGGALLGLGALINGGCIIGTIGKLGSGHWEFVATPAGLAIGSWLIYGWQPQSLKDARIQEVSWPPLYEGLQNIPTNLLLVLGCCLILSRLLVEWQSSGSPRNPLDWLKIAAKPHNATVWIGLCFLGLHLLAPDWSYSNLLDDLARGRTDGLWERLLWLLMLFFGALFAGWRKGIWSGHRPKFMRIVECWLGGMMMGIGSFLIPGGNDLLIFLGIPLLWSFAWCAMASMVITIALFLKLQQLMHL